MDKSPFSFKKTLESSKQKIVAACEVCGEVRSSDQEKCSKCMLLAATDEQGIAQTPMLLAPLNPEQSKVPPPSRDLAQPIQLQPPTPPSWQSSQQNVEKKDSKDAQSSNAVPLAWGESASFGRRLCAGVIDTFLFILITFLYALPATLILVFYIIDPKLVEIKYLDFATAIMWSNLIWIYFPLLNPAIYHAVFESTNLRATPGKWLLKLIVTDENGQRIPFERTLIRVILQETIFIVISIPVSIVAAACTSLFVGSADKTLATLFLNIVLLFIEFVLFASLVWYPIPRHKQALLDLVVGRYVFKKSSSPDSTGAVVQQTAAEPNASTRLPEALIAMWRFCHPLLGFSYWCAIVLLSVVAFLLPLCVGLGGYVAVGCLSVYVVSIVAWHLAPKTKRSKFAWYFRHAVYSLIAVVSLSGFAVSLFHCEKLIVKYTEADRVLEQAYQLDAVGKKREADEIVLKARKEFPERYGLFSMMSQWDQTLLLLFKDPSANLSYKAAALDPDPLHGLLRRAQTYQQRYMRESFFSSRSSQLRHAPQDPKLNPQLTADLQKAALLAKEVVRLSTTSETVADACKIIAMNSASDGVKELTAAIAKYPKTSQLYVLRAECFTTLNQPESAAKDKAMANKLTAASPH